MSNSLDRVFREKAPIQHSILFTHQSGSLLLDIDTVTTYNLVGSMDIFVVKFESIEQCIVHVFGVLRSII